MGIIKDERRNNKQKKALIYAGAGVGIGVCVIAIIFLIGVLIGGDASAGGNSQDSGSSQIESSSNDTLDDSNVDDSGSELPDSENPGSEDVTESETESIIEPEPEPEEIRIMMVGDMLMHDRIIASGLKEDGTYNFDHLFTYTAEYLQSADIAMVNQETIMGGGNKYTGYPTFNSPYELADAEVKAGFDVILHATNHTMDKSKTGVLNCMNYWDTNFPHIKYLGIHKSQEDQDTIYVYEQDGIKVAILNYTYGLNGYKLPSDMPYLVDLMVKGTSESRIISDIKKAEEIADFTIVVPHWGTEYLLTADKTQKYWANLFLENGVDLVIGAHPHVPEPVEWLTDDNGNKMLVYYSLGNYVNGTSSTKGNLAHRMVGGIADVTIGRDETGKVVILENTITPIVCHIGEGDAYTVYFLKDYTEEMAKENRIVLQDSKFSLQACWDVANQVWGE